MESVPQRPDLQPDGCLHPPLLWKGLGGPTLFDARVSCRNGVVRVPYFTPVGGEHNAKLFRLGGQSGSWWQRRGRELIPFGLERLPSTAAATEAATLMICEGESDALAVREHFWLLRSRPVYAIALPGSGTWRRAWRYYVKPFPVVYVLGDGDAAGRHMIDSVLADVPWARPVLLPPREDARSLIQNYSPNALVELIETADRVALFLAVCQSPTLTEALRWLRGADSRAA